MVDTLRLYRVTSHFVINLDAVRDAHTEIDDDTGEIMLYVNYIDGETTVFGGAIAQTLWKLLVGVAICVD